jgi:hypothetical protein
LNDEAILQARLVKMANRAQLLARSKFVEATEGKKTAFVNRKKFKSHTSLNRQGGLLAEAKADVFLSECIDTAKKADQTDSATTTILIDVKRTAFVAKKRITDDAKAKDDAVIINLVDGHRS